jgi:hypothetical protein
LRDPLALRTYALALACLGLLWQSPATRQALAARGTGSGGAAWVEPAGSGDVGLPPAPLGTAELSPDGRTAIPPPGAPEAVR